MDRNQGLEASLNTSNWAMSTYLDSGMCSHCLGFIIQAPGFRACYRMNNHFVCGNCLCYS